MYLISCMLMTVVVEPDVAAWLKHVTEKLMKY